MRELTEDVSCAADAELIVNDSEHLARPEEDRITQAEKNKHMQEQLKVGTGLVYDTCRNN